MPVGVYFSRANRRMDVFRNPLEVVEIYSVSSVSANYFPGIVQKICLYQMMQWRMEIVKVSK